MFILISQHRAIWGEPRDFNQNGDFARSSLGLNQRAAEKLIWTLTRLQPIEEGTANLRRKVAPVKAHPRCIFATAEVIWPADPIVVLGFPYAGLLTTAPRSVSGPLRSLRLSIRSSP
jgi:hypothetical protein